MTENLAAEVRETWPRYYGEPMERLMDENAALAQRVAELEEQARAMRVSNANLTHQLQIAQTQALLVAPDASHPFRVPSARSAS